MPVPPLREWDNCQWQDKQQDRDDETTTNLNTGPTGMKGGSLGPSQLYSLNLIGDKKDAAASTLPALCHDTDMIY